MPTRGWRSAVACHLRAFRDAGSVTFLSCVSGGERAVTNVMQWASGNDWEDRKNSVFAAHLEHFEELGISYEELFNRLGSLGPPFFACIIEDFLSARFGEGGKENVVDGYLARRGWLEKGPARNYLLALRDSTPSLYEVVSFKRGRELTVRDLIRESEPVRVDEKAGSETLGLWDCVFARVVRLGRTRCFTGAVLHFPRELAQHCIARLGGIAKDLQKEIQKAAKKLGEDREASEAEARDFLLQSPKAGVFFTTSYAEWTLERLEAPLLQMRNTDDEPLVLSTVRFPIKGSETEVAAALDDVPEFDRADGNELRWSWQGRSLSPLRLPKELLQDDPEAGVAYLDLGSAEIVDGALLLHLNSVERAERGRELLNSRLGPLLGNPLTSHEDPAQRLRTPPGEPAPEPKKPDLPPEVMEALVRGQYEEHYRQVLDEPVPMLGNRTPRRAAKTKKGRAAVVEWLKGIENLESRSAVDDSRRPVDLSWLWEELKIPRPGGNR